MHSFILITYKEGSYLYEKKELKDKTNLIVEYLYSESILKQSKYIFNMDFFPDFDYTDYKKGITQTYYFHDEIDFSHLLSDIITYENLEPHIFSSNEKPGFLEEYLCEITQKKIESLKENEVSTNFDSFKFQKAKIDNINKKINYDCTCIAEGSFLGGDVVNIYYTTKLCGVVKDITSFDLYKQLIVDSYRKYLNTDYRMAFFSYVLCL